MENPVTKRLTYSVLTMQCAHCEYALTAEISKVAGVRAVEVDLQAKQVIVRGERVADGAVRDAIHEAGYEAPS